MNLSKAQTFSIYKLTEVVIVNKDKYFIFASFQVIVPSF